jgi:hypothetical protein
MNFRLNERKIGKFVGGMGKGCEDVGRPCRKPTLTFEAHYLQDNATVNSFYLICLLFFVKI